MKLRGRSIAGAVIALALQACVTTDGLTPYRAAGSKVLGEKQGSQQIQQLTIDGKNTLLLLVSTVFDDGGSIAICAASRVLGAEDLSPAVWEALNTQGSTLTLTPKGSGYPVTVSAKFIPVSYQHLATGQTTTLMGDSGGRAANCVTVGQPWRPEFATAQLRLHLLRKGVVAR